MVAIEEQVCDHKGGLFQKVTPFQRLLDTIGNFPRFTPLCNLHMAFNLLYMNDNIRKLCRQQVDVIQNHENEHVWIIGQGEARYRKYKRLKLGNGQSL
jgi:hypothetical protein